MRSLLFLLFASLVLSDHDIEPGSPDFVSMQVMCTGTFVANDAVYSRLFFIGNASDPAFQVEFDKLWDIPLLVENFTYDFNGQVASGRNPIYQVLLHLLPRYKARETFPPVTNIYPYNSCSRQHGQTTCGFTTKIIHTFVNSTGSYQDFSDHTWNCMHNEHASPARWLMVNAILRTYLTVRMG